MGKEKAGALTPKAIGNRIKAKGLQKLRWYCQMCQKQCRDENGFKCHCTSESHQRQLLLFADNPDQYLDTFSKDFYEDFITLLKRTKNTKRVHANVVYQEYVAFREHVHMNSTQWETLTDFVKWLGREGHCVVDETPKGWYITYIDKDPEVMARAKAAQKREKQTADDQEKRLSCIEEQIERAKASSTSYHATEFTDLQRDDEEERVTFDFAKPGSSKTKDTTAAASSKPPPAQESVFKAPSAMQDRTSTKKEKERKRPKSALEEILEQEAKEKKRKLEKESARRENWLTEGIVVKIVTKKLGEKYHKKKGHIQEVRKLFTAFVELDGGDTLKLDQTHLETVIPAPGKMVKIVNGPLRGMRGLMVGLNEKNFSVAVKLKEGPQKGEQVQVAYEDVSKLHAS